MRAAWTRREIAWAAALAALGLALLLAPPASGGPRTLVLASDAAGNEALVVAATYAGHDALFMIDTAYAGPPVLSASYLAVERRCAGGDVRARYKRCAALLQREATDDQRSAALLALLREGRCRAYTSGCTMRLMGIGETTEAQADMLLCPGLSLGGARGGAGGVDADVLVTHPLHGSVHILTCDYLLHRAPCVLRPGAGLLHLGLSRLDAVRLRPTFAFLPAAFVGGAFVVPVAVGGAELQIVVDTGAAVPLSLGRTAAARLTACARPSPPARVTQAGVHGERVCSDALTARVAFGPVDLGEVELYVNEGEVEGADGYAGIGLLRALDLWLEPAAFGVRRSGLPPRGAATSAEGSCGKPLPACAA